MVSALSGCHLIFYLYLIVLCYLPIPSYFHHGEQNSVVEMSAFHIHCDGKTGQVWSCGRIVCETGLRWYKGKNRSILSITLSSLPGKLILCQAANLTLGSKVTIGSSIVLRLEICIVLVYHI